MNMHRFVFNISIVLLLLFSNTALFGMKCNYKGVVVVYDKKSKNSYSQFLLKNEPENKLQFSYHDHQSSNKDLVKLALFGSAKDMKKELKRPIYSYDDRVKDTIQDVITYSHEKKDGLEPLLLKLKQMDKCDKIWRGVYGYQLLFAASKNKDMFELVASIDPYDANNLIWRNIASDKKQTNLERMSEDKNFDEKHVRIFKTYGMTKDEAKQMRLVGDIVVCLPRRDVFLLPYGLWCEFVESAMEQNLDSVD